MSSAALDRLLVAAMPTVEHINRLPPKLRARLIGYLMGGLLCHRPDAAVVAAEYIAELQAADAIARAARRCE